jgi:hypothetical protein
MTASAFDFLSFVSTKSGGFCLMATGFFLMSGFLYLRKVRLHKSRKSRNSLTQRTDQFRKVLKDHMVPSDVSEPERVVENTYELSFQADQQHGVEMPGVEEKKSKTNPRVPTLESEDFSKNNEKSYLKVERMLDLGMSVDEIGKRVSIPCCEIELISYLRRNYRRTFEPSAKKGEKGMKTQRHTTGGISLVKGAVYQGVVLERIASQRIRVGIKDRSFWCKSRVEVQPGDTVMLKVDQLEPKIICRLIYRKDPQMGRVAFNI